jgi:queuine tRNA-ribosyltransferase
MVCQSYTRAYLHQIVLKDALGAHLVSYHNIAYQMRLMKGARDAILNGTLGEYVNTFMLKQFPDREYPEWVRNALGSVNIALL